MAYCNEEAIVGLIGAERLIQLTDDDNLGLADQTVLAQAMAAADAEIDFYCAGRYPLPFDPAPPMVAIVAADLTIYHLYKRRQGAPEEWQKSYDQAIKKLRDVAAGLGTLNPQSPAPATVGQAAMIGGNDRLFTRDNQKGL